MGHNLYQTFQSKCNLWFCGFHSAVFVFRVSVFAGFSRSFLWRYHYQYLISMKEPLGSLQSFSSILELLGFFDTNEIEIL